MLEQIKNRINKLTEDRYKYIASGDEWFAAQTWARIDELNRLKREIERGDKNKNG
jgi:hypothetical protein